MNTTKQVNAITRILALLVAKETLSRCRIIANVSSGASRKQAPVLSSLQSQLDPHHMSLKISSAMPTIPQLVGSVNGYECSEGLIVVEDSIDPSFHEKEQRNIPKVIHMTGKTRCMTRAFAANVDSWRFEGYSLFLHDDNAVDRLLNRWWPEFPQILDMKNCMMPGAAIADLWRYVLLWEYGGVYTDIDNAPGPWFWNKTGSVITNSTDALFEQEKDGFPSQYFFAAAPHHPIMYLAVQNALLRLMEVQSVRKQYVPFVTGPGAIKSAVIHFMGGKGYPVEGTYKGTLTINRTVTIVGSPVQARSGHYVIRDARALRKAEGYKEMNMTHWSHIDKFAKPDHSCLTYLADLMERRGKH